jgi:hypothetical protein
MLRTAGYTALLSVCSCWELEPARSRSAPASITWADTGLDCCFSLPWAFWLPRGHSLFRHMSIKRIVRDAKSSSDLLVRPLLQLLIFAKRAAAAALTTISSTLASLALSLTRAR